MAVVRFEVLNFRRQIFAEIDGDYAGRIALEKSAGDGEADA